MKHAFLLYSYPLSLSIMNKKRFSKAIGREWVDKGRVMR
jgi:hypothetical protein